MSYQLLIVDDEVLIRKALSQYIDWESLNCVVHATASNGKEAIKIIEENKIDIVITDVKMPLIDGIELSRYICKNHPNIQLLFYPAMRNLSMHSLQSSTMYPNIC